MSLFNLAPDNIYRNCLDNKRGDCPYAEYEKYPVMKCVLGGDKVVDDSMGCVPDAARAEYFGYLLFSNYYPSGAETFKLNLKFNNVVFASGEGCFDLSGRRYLVDDEVRINEDRLDMELRKIDLQTMADR